MATPQKQQGSQRSSGGTSTSSNSARHSSCLFTYDDFSMFECDARSLLGTNWLTDNVVNFAVAYLRDCILNTDKLKDKVCIVYATLCELIKYSENNYKDRQALFESFGMAAHKWNIFLFNNSADPQMAMSGTHWGLVLFDPIQRQFLYYDPLPGPYVPCFGHQVPQRQAHAPTMVPTVVNSFVFKMLTFFGLDTNGNDIVRQERLLGTDTNNRTVMDIKKEESVTTELCIGTGPDNSPVSTVKASTAGDSGLEIECSSTDNGNNGMVSGNKREGDSAARTDIQSLGTTIDVPLGIADSAQTGVLGQVHHHYPADPILATDATKRPIVIRADADAPKMSVSGDCGIYVIEYVQVILEALKKSPDALSTTDFDFSAINDTFIQQHRRDWLELVKNLSLETTKKKKQQQQAAEAVPNSSASSTDMPVGSGESQQRQQNQAPSRSATVKFPPDDNVSPSPATGTWTTSAITTSAGDDGGNFGVLVGVVDEMGEEVMTDDDDNDEMWAESANHGGGARAWEATVPDPSHCRLADADVSGHKTGQQ